MTYEEIVTQVRELPIEQKKTLINEIVDSLIDIAAEEEPRTHSLLEFRGVSEWDGTDAQEYINQLRSEWDHRP